MGLYTPRLADRLSVGGGDDGVGGCFYAGLVVGGAGFARGVNIDGFDLGPVNAALPVLLPGVFLQDLHRPILARSRRKLLARVARCHQPDGGRPGREGNLQDAAVFLAIQFDREVQHFLIRVDGLYVFLRDGRPHGVPFVAVLDEFVETVVAGGSRHLPYLVLGAFGAFNGT